MIAVHAFVNLVSMSFSVDATLQLWLIVAQGQNIENPVKVPDSNSINVLKVGWLVGWFYGILTI